MLKKKWKSHVTFNPSALLYLWRIWSGLLNFKTITPGISQYISTITSNIKKIIDRQTFKIY